MKAIAMLFSVLITTVTTGQTLLMTRNGQISFYSSTPIENIEAINNEVASMLNPQTGELVFAVLVKSFHFEKALMEEHFNENYMESTQFPKATFSGKILNLSEIDFKVDGHYAAKVEGQITIHGVSKPLQTEGTIELKDGKATVLSRFDLQVDDFDIKIPALVKDRIAKIIAVTVNCQYAPKS